MDYRYPILADSKTLQRLCETARADLAMVDQFFSWRIPPGSEALQITERLYPCLLTQIRLRMESVRLDIIHMEEEYIPSWYRKHGDPQPRETGTNLVKSPIGRAAIDAIHHLRGSTILYTALRDAYGGYLPEEGKEMQYYYKVMKALFAIAERHLSHIPPGSEALGVVEMLSSGFLSEIEPRVELMRRTAKFLEEVATPLWLS
ncbi:hypothetical protein SCP_0204120 [Sparassis crispa]|uniref:Uncharacterized protein n=1 Tax=Sparassis crispa TaxID=139825 RepID=A0A401GAM9_9APHY|nr:hypothetical protein SCP_0204120 [Sparassis crispa]GBE79215.1 hypothetical protein SCP_0204120 [Sparassis crispa]